MKLDLSFVLNEMARAHGIEQPWDDVSSYLDDLRAALAAPGVADDLRRKWDDTRTAIREKAEARAIHKKAMNESFAAAQEACPHPASALEWITRQNADRTSYGQQTCSICSKVVREQG